MDNTNIAERIATLEANNKTIFKQLDDIKKDVNNIQQLTVAVEKIATNTDNISKKVDGLDERLQSVEKAPAEDYKYYKRIVIGCIITGVLGILLGAILSNIK